MKRGFALFVLAVLLTGSLVPLNVISPPATPALTDAPSPIREVPTPAPPAGTIKPPTPAGTIEPSTQPLTPSARPADSDAMEAIQTRLIRHLTEAQSERVIYADIQDFFHEAGFNVPAASELAEFDENETISFPYNLGDVDHDGTDDMLVDTYCSNPEGCIAEISCPFPSLSLECLQQPPNLRIEREQWCITPHRLYLRSGSNGTEIWRRDLSQRPTYIDRENPSQEQAAEALFGRCFYEMVVGEIPSPDGGDTVVIYRVRVKTMPRAIDESVNNLLNTVAMFLGFRPPFFLDFVFEHYVYAIDRFTGKNLWQSPVYNGYCEPMFLVVADMCDTVIVVPILQVPPEQGVRVVPEGTQPALFLQGIGWLLGGAGLVFVPQESAGRTLLAEYQPIEWAARIDLVKGEQLWKKDTFQPYDRGLDTSLFPRALPEQMAPLWTWQRFYSGDIIRALSYYWDYVPCCFDLTGDTVPDMVYTSVEWNNKPSHNTGPYLLASRLHAFDGATGDKIWEVLLDDAMPRDWIEELSNGRGIGLWFELFGDATGDNRSDILVHRVYFQFDYVNVIELFDGATGAKLWSYESPRDLRTLVLGDTNGDGSNDAVLIDWYEWEHAGITHTYDYGNVTAKTLILVNGRDRTPLWRAKTFSAPIDLVFLVNNYRTNGVPDLDGDGIGEFPADDPLVLSDLTVVHRWSFLNGVDGQPIRKLTTVGQFSVPAWAGNVTGNGFDDLMVTSGDIADIWISLYDGESAEAVWSRRVMTPRLSEYTFAIPNLRHIPVHRQWGNDTFLTFHFAIVTCGALACTLSFNPQLASYAPSNGTSAWAYPEFKDQNLTFRVWGPSPASYAFQKLLEDQSRATGYAAATVSHGSYIVPGFIAFAASVLASLGFSRRWWTK